MKKLVLIASALSLLLLFSCSDKNSGGMSDKAKKNIENSRAVGKLFESGDFSKTGDYIASDAVDHATPKGDVKGLDSIKAMFQKYGTMMTGVKNEFIQELGNDDYSALWLKQSWTATVDDPMMGMKKGDHATMETVEVCKHNADSKITEHWTFMSGTDVMKMMPKQPNMADTTKIK
jgi:hypothetical protein